MSTTQFVTEVAAVAPVATTPAAAASATEGGTVTGSSSTTREEVKKEIAAHEERLSYARKHSAELQKELREIDGRLRTAKSEEQSNDSPQLLMLPSQQRLIRAAEENAQNAMRQRRLDITGTLSNIDKEVLEIERYIKMARQRLAEFAPPTVVVKPSPATSKKLPKKKQVPPVAVAVSPAAAVPTVLNAETRAKVLGLLQHTWGYVSHRTGGEPLTADKMRNLPLNPWKVSFEVLLGSVIRADEEKQGERSYLLTTTLAAWVNGGGLERESNVEFREVMKLPPLPGPVVAVQAPTPPPVKPSAPVAPVKKTEPKLPALPPAEKFMTRFDEKEGLTLFMRGRDEKNYQTFVLSREGEVLRGKLDLGELGFEKLIDVFDRPTREKRSLELVDLNAVRRKQDRKQKIEDAQEKKAADERGTVYGAAKTAPAPKKKGEEESGKKKGKGKPGKK